MFWPINKSVFFYWQNRDPIFYLQFCLQAGQSIRAAPRCPPWRPPLRPFSTSWLLIRKCKSSISQDRTSFSNQCKHKCRMKISSYFGSCWISNYFVSVAFLFCWPITTDIFLYCQFECKYWKWSNYEIYNIRFWLHNNSISLAYDKNLTKQ